MAYETIQIEQWLDRFTTVGKRLQRALIDVLEVGLEGPSRAAEIEEAFQLGRTMSFRMAKAVTTDNPREMAMLLPGRPSMMRFIARAEQLCHTASLIEELEDAYKVFLKEMKQIASNQKELSAVLSEHDPEILREASLRQRSARFQIDTNLMGCSTETVSDIWIIQPNKQDNALGDLIYAVGYFGLKRLGTMDPFALFGTTSEPSNATLQPQRLDGQPIDQKNNGPVVRELSTASLPPVRTAFTQNSIHHVYAGDDLPQDECVDLVTAWQAQGWLRNIQPGKNGTEYIAQGRSLPTQLLVSDFLVHHDMWTGIEPILKVYRNAKIPDDAYPDEFWFLEVTNFDKIESISTNQLFHPPNELPKHTQLIHYVIERSNINLENYRAYRIVMRYPVVNQNLWTFFSRKPEEK